MIFSAALLFPLLTNAEESKPATASTEMHLSLQQCLAIGLENNYDLRIIRQQQEISDNNATRGNAGYLPTLDLSSSYSGTVNNTKQSLRDGGTNTSNGVNNNTLNAGLDLNWTAFNGFSVQTTYKRLKELQAVGELNTRMTVEDYVATLAATYYSYTFIH